MPLKRIDEVQSIVIPSAQGEQAVRVRVEDAPRARTLRLYINHAREVVLRLPKRQSLRSAEHFLLKHGDWIVQRLASMPEPVSLMAFLEQQGFVSAFGRRYGVDVADSEVRASYVFFPEADVVCFRVQATEDRNTQMRTVLRSFAKQVITERTFALAKQHGLQIRRVTVRDQVGRWGSCSSSWTISLNWRLVLCAPELHDHIIYHELAHTLEMNHSAAFYEKLRQFDPNMGAHTRTIDQISEPMMALGRS